MAHRHAFQNDSPGKTTRSVPTTLHTAKALKVNGTLTQLIVYSMFPLPIRKGWRSGLGLENMPVGDE